MPDVIPVKALYDYYKQYQQENGIDRDGLGLQAFSIRFHDIVHSQYEKKQVRINNNDWAFDGLLPKTSPFDNPNRDNYQGRVRSYKKL